MTERTYAPGTVLGGFEVERCERIEELRCTAVVAAHRRTGARLVHLVNEDPNNLFCCAFRTPVFDSTGVPHILEHSVLGGSRKYPLKDPFQQLLKCSLQTFLNAMTYPDKTVYPVGSQVEKDFYNLVDVYCDAVFNPLLSERIFAQEGWHFDVEDLSKPVSIKGIVYNEMKGVFSDFSSHVVRRTLSALYPDTTYFHESGGDPAHIPALTYEAFREFHARYYHPSNAFIYLYGSQDTERTCRFVDEGYLSAFNRLDIDSHVTPQKRWKGSRTVTIEAPAPKEDAGTATVDVCWVFGESTDPVRTLAGHVLGRYLLGGESSPLRRALVDSGLGEDLDELSGFDADMVQSMFAAGLRKTRPEHAQAVRDVVFDTLRTQAAGGIDRELLEGVLRQTEFGLREVADSGRWPYSLRLAERVYRSWIYGGDPLAHLRFGTALAAIRGNGPIEQYFAGQIRDGLLENPHCLVSVVKASPEMGAQLQHHTEEQARTLSAGFTDEDRKQYHELTTALLAEQARPLTAEELAVLPRIKRADLPTKGQQTPTEEYTEEGVRVLTHPLFCGGIAYVDLYLDLSNIPDELVPYELLYSDMLTRAGAAGCSAEQMATRVALATGGLRTRLLHEYTSGPSPRPERRLVLGSACMVERYPEMVGILLDLVGAPGLDDRKLVGDILLEMRNDTQNSVLSSGHTLASLHAAGRLDPLWAEAERQQGISQLRFLEQRVRAQDAAETIDRLQQLHRAVMRRADAVLSVVADNPRTHREQNRRIAAALGRERVAARAADAWVPSGGAPLGIEVNSAVNFAAKAWALAPREPELSGLLAVMSAHLSRGYLWDRVRVEGGAYGVFASAAGSYPVYTCASFRDPNIGRTLRVFDEALEHARSGIDDSAVAESVVSTIGQMDRPRTPYARGAHETMALLHGHTPQFRQRVRESVLGATAPAVRAAAESTFAGAAEAVSVLGSAAAFDAAAAEGLALRREPLLPA